MGVGPTYTNGQSFGDLARQQQQNYQQQFADNSPIPGVTGPINQPTPLASGFSNDIGWNELNGRLIGNTYLPPDVSTVDLGKGWYEVHHGGGRVGTLRPGGPNGLFINDTSYAFPQPGLPGVPSTPGGQPGAGNMRPPPSQNFMTAGPYGAQAMQMAGLLGQQQQPPPTGVAGGLLGGKAPFRPGGK